MTNELILRGIALDAILEIIKKRQSCGTLSLKEGDINFIEERGGVKVTIHAAPDNTTTPKERQKTENVIADEDDEDDDYEEEEEGDSI